MHTEFRGRANEHNNVPTFLAAYVAASGCAALLVQFALSFAGIGELEYDPFEGNRRGAETTRALEAVVKEYDALMSQTRDRIADATDGHAAAPCASSWHTSRLSAALVSLSTSSARISRSEVHKVYSSGHRNVQCNGARRET